jgi:hypothetical protein
MRWEEPRDQRKKSAPRQSMKKMNKAVRPAKMMQ